MDADASMDAADPQFGRRLKRILKAKRLTPADLAGQVTGAGHKLDPSTVSKWNKGHSPRAKTIEAVCDVLGLAQNLFDFEDEEFDAFIDELRESQRASQDETEKRPSPADWIFNLIRGTHAIVRHSFDDPSRYSVSVLEVTDRVDDRIRFVHRESQLVIEGEIMLGLGALAFSGYDKNRGYSFQMMFEQPTGSISALRGFIVGQAFRQGGAVAATAAVLTRFNDGTYPEEFRGVFSREELARKFSGELFASDEVLQDLATGFLPPGSEQSSGFVHRLQR